MYDKITVIMYSYMYLFIKFRVGEYIIMLCTYCKCTLSHIQDRHFYDVYSIIWLKNTNILNLRWHIKSCPQL